MRFMKSQEKKQKKWMEIKKEANKKSTVYQLREFSTVPQKVQEVLYVWYINVVCIR